MASLFIVHSGIQGLASDIQVSGYYLKEKNLYAHFVLLHLIAREKMAQSYDFALEKIGMDIQSFSIWNEYATFLKQVEAVGSYAENQRISAVRKVCMQSA